MRLLAIILFCPACLLAQDNGVHLGQQKDEVISRLRSSGYRIVENSFGPIQAFKDQKVDSMFFCPSGELRSYSIGLAGDVSTFIQKIKDLNTMHGPGQMEVRDFSAPKKINTLLVNWKANDGSGKQQLIYLLYVPRAAGLPEAISLQYADEKICPGR